MNKLLFAIVLVFVTIGIITNIARFGNDYSTKINIGNKTYMTDLANTALKRETGLSYRKSMCGECGMLFVFEKDDQYAIWMRDMNFDIDLVFVDSSMTIVDVFENFKKESYYNVPPEKYINKVIARYLIELNAGEWDKSGAQIGDKIEISDNKI